MTSDAEHGRSPDGSGHSAEPEPSSTVSAVPVSVPNAALAGADDWEVGPCVDRLGHVTSWDINVRPQLGDRGVAVIASVYSGEVVARAILAAIQTAAIKARRAALTRMVQLDEEMGLYDDEAIATEAGTAETENTGSVHEGAGPQDIAQPQSPNVSGLSHTGVDRG